MKTKKRSVSGFRDQTNSLIFDKLNNDADKRRQERASIQASKQKENTIKLQGYFKPKLETKQEKWKNVKAKI
jgi:hypothetical protein